MQSSHCVLVPVKARVGHTVCDTSSSHNESSYHRVLSYLLVTAIEQPTASRRRAKRGNYAPSRARREQIASAVLQIVDQSGYGDVTVIRISKETGIPQSSVLYHFPTKDHLLVGAMEYADSLDGKEYNLESAWP